MRKLSLLLIAFIASLQFANAQTDGTCCPPIKKTDVYNNLFKTDQTPGLLSSPYSLSFKPTAAFKGKMEAYVNYLLKLCPTKKFVIAYEVYKVSGTGVLPSSGSPAYVSTQWHIFTPGFGPINDVNFGGNAYYHPAQASLAGKMFQVGDTYCFKIWLSSEPGPNCFSSGCDPGYFWVKIPNPIDGGTLNRSSTQIKSTPSKLEIYDENGNILKN